MEILEQFGPTIVLALAGLLGIAKLVVNAMAKRPIVETAE